MAAATVSLSSCYDLDRFPDNQLSSGTTFKSEDGCKTGMMGVYALMRGDNVLGKYFFNDAQGGRMYVYDQFDGADTDPQMAEADTVPVQLKASSACQACEGAVRKK